MITRKDVTVLALALSIGALLIGLGAVLSAPAQAGVESTHEVPDWMNRVCAAEDSVNCWFDADARYGNTGPIFIRQMPGTNRVCVLFADKPRRDYCEKRR